MNDTDHGEDGMAFSYLEIVTMFAAGAHAGQKRKYTNESYILHPIEVMVILRDLGVLNTEALAAALLHDVIEDTAVTEEILYEVFGPDVTALVVELTDVTTHADGNRETRKAIECKRLAEISPLAQTIKYADFISNTRSIVKYDPDFAKVYLKEKRAALEVMTLGLPRLREIAFEVLESGEKTLAEMEVSK